MQVEDENNTREELLKELGLILGEYIEWYNHTLRGLYYPSDGRSRNLPLQPQSLLDWLERAEKQSIIEAVLSNPIQKIHDQLADTAHKLFEKNNGDGPSLNDFDEYSFMYEDLYRRLWRIEQDSQLTDGGIDPQTGLRTMDVFERDIKREKDRRSRLDIPFCLVLCRIDGFTPLVFNQLDGALNDPVRQLAQNLQNSLRTFDDAYRKSGIEFILSLKNTDLYGAGAALKRIHKCVHEKAISYSLSGKSGVLSLSFAVSEVLPEANIQSMLDEMAMDLDKRADQSGAMIEYKEQSKLEKYIQSIEKA